jgi:adenylate kinase family enzyme
MTGTVDRSPTLREALATLVDVAVAAGVPGDVARTEGLSLAAAVAESAPGAAPAWAAVVGDAAGTQDFFDAATRGRRWRAAPTVTLSGLAGQGSPHAAHYALALAEVASAACGLGEPTMRVIGNASVAAAAQLQAANVRLSAEPATRHTGEAAARTEAAGVPGRPAEPAPARSLEDLLGELDALVGLARVKREVHRQVALMRVEKLRAEAGLHSPTITRHLVFVGNPGTGKTTVARLVGGIYRALGLLTTGQLVEVDRSEVVSSAIGGVLFIDEAYSLTGDQYGEEAVDTLVKEMEDHRDDLVVIVAGYPAPMEAFVAANPGLASRFRTTITFEDYTDEELRQILTRLADAADYTLGPGCVEAFTALLGAVPRGSAFGNGRYARNVLEGAIGRHAWRLRDVAAPTTEQLRLLLPEDLRDPDEDDADDTAVDTEPATPDRTSETAGPQPGGVP